jgi:polyhydroxyalkanoate synthesis repressor PhaR
MEDPVTAIQPTAAAPVVIKKYANRRLYNTATSSYVTLENLSQMVRQGGDFVVYDAKTGDDITRSVFTQIIVEEEQKGQNLLPIGFLRQLIGFYGNNMQWLVPRYLEYALKSFSRNQDQLAKSVGGPFGGLFPFGPLEEMGKQNMALFEQAVKMFTPFNGEPGASVNPPEPAHAPEKAAMPAAAPDNAKVLKELTERLNQLQSQLETLSRNGTSKAE